MAVILSLVFMLLSGACSTASTEINEVGLEYSGGAFEEKEYLGTIPPGSTRSRINWGGEVYRYPNDIRTWNFSGDPNDGDIALNDALVFPTKGSGALAQSEGYMRYVLCEDAPGAATTLADHWSEEGEDAKDSQSDLEERCLRSFHENIGLKTEAWTTSGWINMLLEFLRPPTQQSVNVIGKGFALDDLTKEDENGSSRVEEFNERALEEVPQAIADYMGGYYFYIGEASFSKVRPVSSSVQQAYDDYEINRLAALAEGQLGEQRDQQVLNDQKLLNIYGDPALVVCVKQLEASEETGTPVPVCLASSGSAAVPTVEVGGSSD